MPVSHFFPSFFIKGQYFFPGFKYFGITDYAMLQVITRKEAEILLHKKNGLVRISLDLGRSQTDVVLGGGFAKIGDDSIELKDFDGLKEDACYAIEDGMLKQIAFFSDDTSLYYKLVPTKDWPTVTFSSTPMHRFTHISPKRNAELMIRELSPVRGFVLDTCCGLGYTAILSSKSAEVITYEKDHNVLRIASYNPYSRELFENGRITLSKKDVSASICIHQDNSFDRIIHDPPTFKYAGELYSLAFYKELCRVLKPKGILYHYTPSPGKTHGRKFHAGILGRLKSAGLGNVEYHELSSGIRAVKPR
jgi:predicted methyltransferase